MPRSFDVSLESPASVEQVLAAFGDENYWLARLASMEGGTRTLESLTVGPDGAVHVVNTEDLRRGGLPGILAAVYRGDLNVVNTEKWTPIGDGRVSGEIGVAVTGAPGSGHGTAVLARAGSGSRLSLSGTVEFNVPVLGGRIESYIAAQFAAGLAEIQRLTTRWIIEHA